MGDWPAEWTGVRLVDIDVYPLMVFRYISKSIDHVLGDHDRFCPVAPLFGDEPSESLDIADRYAHVYQPFIDDLASI